MEWTRDKTVALINEYRKRRELWDMTADDYRKKDMKIKYLTEVSKNLGGVNPIPIEEIEKKFHTLRTQYHREINRMKRKDTYISKWFAFKSLQFLSSPRACRTTNKGRIKSEITEEGTVTTKYVITEAGPLETSGGSINSSSTIQDEFLTIHRKPSNVGTGRTTNRSQELEKLIEETTKDVQDNDMAKPKVSMKEVILPIDDEHSYEDGNMANHSEQMQTDDENDGHNHHGQQQQHMEEDLVEGIAIQAADGEITYHHSTNAQQGTLHGLPRIIKIQPRDTLSGHDDDYYHHAQPQQSQQQQQQHIHTLSAGTKRIYYNANGQQHTATILTPATPSNTASNNTTLLSTNTSHRTGQPQSPTTPSNQHNTIRDEFTTYGEYVANEMRGLTNREVLIALKHKINTALFEASMAELQK